MARIPATLLCAVAFAAGAPALAAAQSVAAGARSLSMGGTGVASAEPFSAAFLNPALTRFRDEDRGTTVALPFVSIIGSDNDNLLERVEDFQDTIDLLQARIDANDPSAATLRPLAREQLEALDRRTVNVDADAGVAVLLPMQDFTLTISARTYAEARAFPYVAPSDLDLIADPNATSAQLDNLASSAIAIAGEVSEFAATVAFEGALDGKRFSVGIAPKFMSVDVTNYAQAIGDFDDSDAASDVRDGRFQMRDTGFNADVGAAYEFGDGATFGVAVRDVLRADFDSVAALGETFTYRVRPKPTAGIALQQSGVLFTADADLWPQKPFSIAGESQFVRMGCEIELGALVRARAGFAHDIRNAKADTFSFGLGSNKRGALQWGLAGAIGDRSAGAAIQASFSF